MKLRHWLQLERLLVAVVRWSMRCVIVGLFLYGWFLVATGHSDGWNVVISMGVVEALFEGMVYWMERPRP